MTLKYMRGLHNIDPGLVSNLKRIARTSAVVQTLAHAAGLLLCSAVLIWDYLYISASSGYHNPLVNVTTAVMMVIGISLGVCSLVMWSRNRVRSRRLLGRDLRQGQSSG